MRNDFDWQFDNEPGVAGPPFAPRPGASNWARRLLALALLSLLVAAGARTYADYRAAQQELLASVQGVLEQQREAWLAGDGDLYVAQIETDPAWFAAHLLPRQHTILRAGQRAGKVEQRAETIWANVIWQEAGHSYQRVRFFRWHGGQLREIASDAAYWGAGQRKAYGWGALLYNSADEVWAVQVSDHIDRQIAALCQSGCAAEKLPLTVDIRADERVSAAAGRVSVPSPRLVGLDSEGRPSTRFWSLLDKRLGDYLTPATLRFAIPPQRLQRIDYAAAARAFSQQTPGIAIELVTLDTPTLSADALAGLDGAAFVPELAWLGAGLVYDLTDFTLSDGSFDRADFYEQLWQGALWRERLWFMPLAADMPLLYYHRAAYEGLALGEPPLHWTWSEMQSDAVALTHGRLESGAPLQWGFLDQTSSTLYAYAFSHQEACRSQTVRPCPAPLAPADVAGALDWYAALIGTAETTPDVSGFSADEQRRLVINSLFKTGIWVDSPVYYEHRALMFPMGVTTFPGSERFEGGAPLWLNGAFISGASPRPLAVWEWLKFLSHQPPMARYRLIPARPSVAGAAGFWSGLPREVGEPMRAAFPLARPVRLADQGLFSWEQVGAIVAGETSSAAAAAARPGWFGDP